MLANLAYEPTKEAFAYAHGCPVAIVVLNVKRIPVKVPNSATDSHLSKEQLCRLKV